MYQRIRFIGRYISYEIVEVLWETRGTSVNNNLHNHRRV